MGLKFTRRISVIAALVLAAAVTSCGGEDRQPVASASPLDGRTFISHQVQGQGLVDGTEIRLSFEHDQISINAGCNHLFGTLESVSDERLSVTGVGGTEMGCDPARHDQDAWITDFLASSPRWSLAGNELTLSGATVEMVLVDRVEADPDRPLTQTRWVVDSVSSGSGADDSVSSVPEGSQAYFVFSDSDFEGSTGCNTMSGTYRSTDDTITVSSIAQTAAACIDPAATELEAAVRAVLKGQVRYEITADRLTLRASSGQGLILHADE